MMVSSLHDASLSMLISRHEPLPWKYCIMIQESHANWGNDRSIDDNAVNNPASGLLSILGRSFDRMLARLNTSLAGRHCDRMILILNDGPSSFVFVVIDDNGCIWTVELSDIRDYRPSDGSWYDERCISDWNDDSINDENPLLSMTRILASLFTLDSDEYVSYPLLIPTKYVRVRMEPWPEGILNTDADDHELVEAVFGLLRDYADDCYRRHDSIDLIRMTRRWNRNKLYGKPESDSWNNVPKMSGRNSDNDDEWGDED